MTRFCPRGMSLSWMSYAISYCFWDFKLLLASANVKLCGKGLFTSPYKEENWNYSWGFRFTLSSGIFNLRGFLQASFRERSQSFGGCFLGKNYFGKFHFSPQMYPISAFVFSFPPGAERKWSLALPLTLACLSSAQLTLSSRWETKLFSTIIFSKKRNTEKFLWVMHSYRTYGYVMVYLRV